jgi:DNA topoisomerase-1
MGSIVDVSIPTDRGSDVGVLMRKAGLVRTKGTWLSISRRKAGKGNAYFKANGERIADDATIKRLNGLSVPPAYVEVKYAAQPSAHLQAIGRDVAGRLQYRYHPDWERVREERKRARLIKIIKALPKLKAALARDLKGGEPTKTYVIAACVELVFHTAIRAGASRYEASSGSRGATTLLSSNVKCSGQTLHLSFKGKGGKQIVQTVKRPRLVAAICGLKAIPGKYLFQYREGEGPLCRLRAADVNAYLKTATGVVMSLKDFRTLWGTKIVADELAPLEPAPTPTARRRQLRGAVERAAEQLANTPTVAMKSYVQDCVVAAFESGRLHRIHQRMGAARDRGLAILARVVEGGAKHL